MSQKDLAQLLMNYWPTKTLSSWRFIVFSFCRRFMVSMNMRPIASAAQMTHWWLKQKFPRASYSLAGLRSVMWREKTDWTNLFLLHNSELNKRLMHTKQLWLSCWAVCKLMRKTEKKVDKGRQQYRRLKQEETQESPWDSREVRVDRVLVLDFSIFGSISHKISLYFNTHSASLY